MFINKLSVTLFNRHPTHFLSALSRTATIGNGALFYTIPTDVEQSEIPEVRDAVKETQSEDKAARKVVQEAEKAGVLATNKAEREAIAANAEAKRRQHQNNAIGHLRNAEKFVVGENRIVILLEIAQRYRDSENCDEAAIYFYLATDLTEQIHLREYALQANHCQDLLDMKRQDFDSEREEISVEEERNE